MNLIALLLAVIAIVLFLLAAWNVPSKVSLVALGLAFYVTSYVVQIIYSTTHVVTGH